MRPHPRTGLQIVDQLEGLGDSLADWLRGVGIVIALVVIGAVLLHRFVQWTVGKLMDRIDRIEAEGELRLVPSERAKYRRSLVQASAYALIALIWVVAAGWILAILDLDLRSFLVPATVLGLAVGWSAQVVVGDLINGFLILAERQYSIGDLVRISKPGQTLGISGTVEDITLRSTVVRTLDGQAVTIGNGAIRQVANLSKEFSKVIIDVPLAQDVSIRDAERVLQDVCARLYEEEAWQSLLLEQPLVRGIDRIAVGTTFMQVEAKTIPARQFDIGRELRRRVSVAFADAGLELARPIRAPRPEG